MMTLKELKLVVDKAVELYPDANVMIDVYETISIRLPDTGNEILMIDVNQPVATSPELL